MRLIRRAPLALVFLLLALAACGGGGDESAPPQRAGTVAYVVTSCRQISTDMTVQQELRIVRGEVEAVTAFTVGPLGLFAGLGTRGINAERTQLAGQEA